MKASAGLISMMSSWWLCRISPAPSIETASRFVDKGALGGEPGQSDSHTVSVTEPDRYLVKKQIIMMRFCNDGWTGLNAVVASSLELSVRF